MAKVKWEKIVSVPILTLTSRHDLGRSLFSLIAL